MREKLRSERETLISLPKSAVKYQYILQYEEFIQPKGKQLLVYKAGPVPNKLVSYHV